MARKQQTGTVLTDSNDKSLVVGVSWLQRDRIYKKARRKLTKFVVHDENNDASVGDRVLIEESRPVSKTKRWRLVDIVEKVDVADAQPGAIVGDDERSGAANSAEAEE